MHIDTIDFLKGAAILGVIAMHTCISHACQVYGTFVEILLVQSVPIFLVLMGVVNGISLNSKDFNLLPYLSKKIDRFVFPLIPIFFVTLGIGYLYRKPIYIGWANLFGQMPVSGMGEYFIMIVLSSIFTIPVLWFVSKKNMYLMLIGSFVISLLFEYIPLPMSIFFVFRYLFAFAIGIYLAEYIGKKSVPLWYQWGILVSTCLVVYLGLTGIPLFNVEYTYFNVLTFMFTSGLILTAISLNLSLYPINYLGKASYHIFLVQMVFFILFNFGYLLNVLITCSIGILFFYLENCIRSNI